MSTFLCHLQLDFHSVHGSVLVSVRDYFSVSTSHPSFWFSFIFASRIQPEAILMPPAILLDSRHH